MKKLVLFIVILSLTACASTPPVNSRKTKEKEIQKRNDVIDEMTNLHAAEEWK